MTGRNLRLALVALISASCVPVALAQDDEEGAPQPLPSLTERLEQFRQELVGEPGEAARRAAINRENYKADLRSAQLQSSIAPQEKPTASPAPAKTESAAAKPAAQKTATSTKSKVIPTQARSPVSGPTTAVKTPAKMDVQAARKARPSKGLIPNKTPPEREPAIESEDAQPEAESPQARQAPTPQRALVEEDLPAGRSNEPRLARSAGPRQLPARAVEETADVPRSPETPDQTARPSADLTGVLFTTQSPVLSVEAIGPRKVLIGKEAQFAVKIRNTGAAANNVLVTLNIPDYVEVASAHATAGSVPTRTAGQDQGPLEWKISRLEAKSGHTLNLTLVPRKSTPLDLAVHWTFTPEASQTLVEVQEPKLVMTISGPEEVMYGQSKIYKLTLSNPGNGDSENVVIGLLPVGRAAEGLSSHRFGTLRAGETKTIDVELTARQAGTISIKAQAYADGGLRTEAATQVVVRRASLQVDVEAPKVKYAGTAGTYRVKVVNSGNATADNVQVAAMLPPDAKYLSSNSGGSYDAQQGKVSWSAGTLQPGAERVFDMQCALGTPGNNRLQFAAMADDNLSAAASATTQVEALADLKIEVRDPQGPVAVGDDALYEIVIRNRGTKAADGVELAAFFSEGLEATTVEGGAHEIGSGQVTFKPIAAVGPGETQVFRVHARADRTGSHVFRAELVCQSLNTKLAAEEATHFYGDEAAAPAEAASRPEPQEPTPAAPLENDTAEAPPEDSQ